VKGRIDEEACAKLGAAAGEAVEAFMYQKFIREYIRNASPYRGVLVYHGLGSGKTCSAIAAAEALIAQKADGALRDALSIFDQIVSFCGTTITHKDVLENLNILDHDYYFKVVENALNEDIPANLLLFNDVMEKGFDAHHFVVGLADHFRSLLVCKDPRTATLLEVGEATEKLFVDQAKKVDANICVRALSVLSRTDVEYKASKNQRLLVEMALMQLCSLKAEQEKKNP
jgi:DNA polymerase-3 subunit gamma/tau